MIESASFRCLQHSRGERYPDAVPLPFIADHQPNFCGGVVDRRKAAKRHDFGAIGHVQLREKGLFTEGQVAYASGQLDAGRQKLERAVATDDRYAQAWALLSKTYARLAAPSTFTGGSLETYHQKAPAAARRAVELDPALYDAHVALALAHRELEDVGPWRAEAQKAIDVNPRAAEGSALLADSYGAPGVELQLRSDSIVG